MCARLMGSGWEAPWRPPHGQCFRTVGIPIFRQVSDLPDYGLAFHSHVRIGAINFEPALYIVLFLVFTFVVHFGWLPYRYPLPPRCTRPLSLPTYLPS
jgi:hypothetical protein